MRLMPATTKADDLSDVMGDDYDELDGEIEDMLQAGYSKAYTAAWIDDEDEPDEATKDKTSWDKVKEQIPDMRDVLIYGAGYLVGSALVEQKVEEQATSFAANELTVAFTAGTVDSSLYQEIFVVQIVASAGECGFCQEYDGRILHLDEESGMPPLHNGCQCDVEPLEPER